MPGETLTVLVYSDDSRTREQVRLALGRRPAADLPALEYVECATPWAAVETLRAGGIDLAVLDGEAVPAGGLGVTRTVRAEIFSPPPILVLLGRPQDRWLASWSGADAVAAHPIDPLALAEAVAGLLRDRLPVQPGSDLAAHS